MNHTILLVGGTRGTGLLIAKLLQDQGHQVRALARNPAAAAARLGSWLEVIAGDITKADTLLPAVHGASHIIFTAGVRSGRLARDTLVKATLFRWGNCDSSHGFLSGTCQFNSAEVPTGLSRFANAVPATRTLPASFFLSARPSWWGTAAWPPIGPDMIGGTASGVGGLAYLIPAELCYSRMVQDPAYLSLDPAETVSDNLAGKPGIFNADTCYIALPSANPSTPTNFRAQ